MSTGPKLMVKTNLSRLLSYIMVCAFEIRVNLRHSNYRPRSFLVRSYLFGVCQAWQTIILGFIQF